MVLEGRNRPGGRVWSMPLEGGGYAGAADLGGAIITGEQ
jgi:monoamine oxidase